MTQRSAIRRLTRTEIGEESAFATEPGGAFPNAMTAVLVPQDELVIDGLDYEALQDMDEATLRDLAKNRFLGLKNNAKVRAGFDMRFLPTTAFLGSGAVLATLSHRLWYRHMFGTEHAAAGSTVLSGTSSTVFTCQDADAANFVTGTWIAVQNAGGGYDPTCIDAIATVGGHTQLTVSPALSGTPAMGNVIRNGYNYARAQSRTSTLTIRRTFSANSELEWRARGVMLDLQFALGEFGKVIRVMGEGAAADWDDPTTITPGTFSTTPVLTDMGGKVVFQAPLYLASRGSLAITASAVKYEGLDVKSPTKIVAERDGGSVNTIAGWLDAGGRDPAPVVGTLKTRIDITRFTDFTGRTALRAALVFSSGSGANKTFVVIDVPTLSWAKVPKPAGLDERLGLELPFEGYPDAGPGGVPIGTDAFSFAALRFALI